MGKTNAIIIVAVIAAIVVIAAAALVLTKGGDDKGYHSSDVTGRLMIMGNADNNDYLHIFH